VRRKRLVKLGYITPGVTACYREAVLQNRMPVLADTTVATASTTRNVFQK